MNDQMEAVEESKQMRGYLINKNLCFYYWLRKRVGKKRAFGIANATEKLIVLFGRQMIPSSPLPNKCKTDPAKRAHHSKDMG